jgi:hypothetical protein
MGVLDVEWVVLVRMEYAYVGEDKNHSKRLAITTEVVPKVSVRLYQKLSACNNR